MSMQSGPTPRARPTTVVPATVAPASRRCVTTGRSSRPQQVLGRVPVPVLALAAMSALALAASAPCHAQATADTADLPALPSAEILDNGALAELIRDLGSARQDEREAATERLMGSGASLDAPAWRAFAQTSQYEVRRRIRLVMRELFLAKRLGPPPSFLGISYLPYPVDPAVDGRVPAGFTALRLNSVVPWSAASRAGLQRADLVVALNGRRFLPPDSPLEIPAWIRKQPLGTPCRLSVIRGGTGKVLNDDSTPGFDPRAFGKIETQVVTTEDEPRLTPGSAALRISNAARADPRLALAEGDLIVALDGQPLPADEPLERLSAWARGDWVGSPTVKTPAGEAQSAQVLRGGEYLTCEAVLGRRPSHLPDTASDRRGGVSATLYEDWWAQWLSACDPPGVSENVDATWRLEP